MSGYEIRVMSNEEFDTLPYKKARESLGLADPKTNVAYIRKTGIKDLDEGTISHELDELLMKVSPHEEDGIRYKAWIPFLMSVIKAAAISAAVGGTMGGIKSKMAGGKFWGRGMGQGAKWGAITGAAGGALGALGKGTSALGTVKSGAGEATKNFAVNSANTANVVGGNTLSNILGDVTSNFGKSISGMGSGGAVTTNIGSGLSSGLQGALAGGIGSSFASGIPQIQGISSNFSLGSGTKTGGSRFLSKFKPAFESYTKGLVKSVGKEYAGGGLAPPKSSAFTVGREGSALGLFGRPLQPFNPSSYKSNAVLDDFKFGQGNISANTKKRVGNTMSIFRRASRGDISGNSALQRQLTNIRNSQGASEQALMNDLEQGSFLKDRYMQIKASNRWSDNEMARAIRLINSQDVGELRKWTRHPDELKNTFAPFAQFI